MKCVKWLEEKAKSLLEVYYKPTAKWTFVHRSMYGGSELEITVCSGVMDYDTSTLSVDFMNLAWKLRHHNSHLKEEFKRPTIGGTIDIGFTAVKQEQK